MSSFFQTYFEASELKFILTFFLKTTPISQSLIRLSISLFLPLPPTAADARTYTDVMRETMLERERNNTLANIARKQREEAEKGALQDAVRPAIQAAAAAAGVGAKRSRWGDTDADATPAVPGNKWDATPGPSSGGGGERESWFFENFQEADIYKDRGGMIHV